MRNKFRSNDVLKRWPLAVVLLLAIVSSARARDYAPHVMYAFPAGGQRGTTIEGVMARGRGLEGTSEIRVSGKGVTAKVEAIEKPSTRLRQRSANRQDQAENPNVVKFSVTIAPDAEIGARDLWLITPKGATNRLHFVVGQLPEVREADEVATDAQPQLLESLPILVNGQYNQGDRDVFRFQAKAGQTLVCKVQGQELKPYIADAVPGWFQPCLTLYDAAGKELKFVDDFRFHPDPLLIFKVEKDGEYRIEVKDALFRGREDLVYRLSLGVLPYITHIFPLGAQRGTTAEVELHGVNLPTPNTSVAVPDDSLRVRQVQVPSNGLVSNSLPFAAGEHPEIAEVEPNNSMSEANPVASPVTINGRIQQSGDVDHFRFSALKGQRVVLDLHGRRLDSPIDSIVTLLDANGKQLAENDDTKDPSEGLMTHHADSFLNYAIPADGDYLVRIQDVQGQGGEAYAYRLSVAPPRLDYDLRFIPANLSVEKGASAMAKIKAYRRDGFRGEIRVTFKDLPAGLVASPTVLSAGQSEARLTITALPDAATGVIAPQVFGTAILGSDREKKSAATALAKLRGELSKAKGEYQAAEKTASDARAAADQTQAASVAAVADTAAKQKASEEAKPAQVQAQQSQSQAQTQAAEAKKKLADLAAQVKAAEEELGRANAQLAAATTTIEMATKAAQAAQAATAAQKVAADKAAAAEKTAAERRKAADAAKAKQDKLVANEPAAVAKLAEADKKLAESAAQRNASPAEELMQAFYYWHDVPTEEFLLATVQPTAFALSTPNAPMAIQEIHQEGELSIVVKVARDAMQPPVARGEAEKNVAAAALAKAKEDVAKAKADYAAAEKAAQAAQAAVPQAKAAVAKAATAHSEAQKVAAAKRQLADEAKKNFDDLVAKQKESTDQEQASIGEQVAAATTAHQAAEKAAQDSQAAMVAAKAQADSAQATLAAAEKDAPEKRKLADQAKAKPTALAKAEKAANAKLAEANKRLVATQAIAKGVISLNAESLPPGVTLKGAKIAAEQNQATVTLAVSKKAPVGVRYNIIISGTIRASGETITRIAPAIPIRVLAAQTKK